MLCAMVCLTCKFLLNVMLCGILRPEPLIIRHGYFISCKIKVKTGNHSDRQ